MLQMGLAYDNTSSVTINFYNKFCDVQQKKHIALVTCRLTTLIEKIFSKSLNTLR